VKRGGEFYQYPEKIDRNGRILTGSEKKLTGTGKNEQEPEKN